MSHLSTHAAEVVMPHDDATIGWPSVFRYNDFPLYNGKSVKVGLLTRSPKNAARNVQVIPAHLARGLQPPSTPASQPWRIRAASEAA